MEARIDEAFAVLESKLDKEPDADKMYTSIEYAPCDRHRVVAVTVPHMKRLEGHARVKTCNVALDKRYVHVCVTRVAAADACAPTSTEPISVPALLVMIVALLVHLYKWFHPLE